MKEELRIRRKGKQGRPVVKVDIATFAIKDGDDIVYENNYRAVYWLGVMVYKKRLRMSIKKDERKKTGSVYVFNWEDLHISWFSRICDIWSTDNGSISINYEYWFGCHQHCR